MNFDTMPAGREIDALVAEKVMGLRPCTFKVGARFSAWATAWECEHKDSRQCYPSNSDAIEHAHSILRRYSTDIAAAWTILDHFVDFKIDHDGQVYGWIDVEVMMLYHNDEPAVGKARVWKVSEIPLAICRAALAALRAAQSDETSTV